MLCMRIHWILRYTFIEYRMSHGMYEYALEGVRSPYTLYEALLVHSCDITLSYQWYDSFVCVTWRMRVCISAWQHTWCVTSLIYVCDIPHPYVWHDSLIRVTRLIHTCDISHSYVQHEWALIRMWDMNEYSSICVTWMMIHWYVWHVLCMYSACVLLRSRVGGAPSHTHTHMHLDTHTHSCYYHLDTHPHSSYEDLASAVHLLNTHLVHQYITHTLFHMHIGMRDIDSESTQCSRYTCYTLHMLDTRYTTYYMWCRHLIAMC